ncbi:MAG: ABC transporter transmembrane domain-containing protein, partial [Alphaproteobacteria bacterium]|nr:ABC transporter transmembrane domain-containing protein [Alphaproteobacteria bacterium]
RYSRIQQITTLLLILLSFPFLYYSLDLPKIIVNEAIGGDKDIYTLFEVDFLGFAFEGIQLNQINYLLSLCFIFLALVCVNGGFKLKINTYKGVMAERLLRRIRYILLERSLRFPLKQFRKTSSGEIVTMVTAEVEPLGGFFGDAFALLAFQGGTFLTIMFFMFVQDPYLGLAAFISIPVQGYIIPKLQKKVNLLGKERVKHVRALSNRINEIVGGVEDIHIHDHSKFILADVSKRLSDIFWIRFEIYKRKFFMKFLNNFIGMLTPFFFYSVGGYMVLTGDLTLGALVAALAAYKDLAAPWKELLNYYQRMADSKIKYEQILSQFIPSGLLDEKKFKDTPEETTPLVGDFQLVNVTLSEDDINPIENATLTIRENETTLITSANGASRDSIARLLTRLEPPTKGKISIGSQDIQTLHEAEIGSAIGYLNPSPTFFDQSIADNLFLGLKQVPDLSESESQLSQDDIDEAMASGNSVSNVLGNWSRYPASKDDTYESLRHEAVELLHAVEMSDDLFNLGLRQIISVEKNKVLTEKIMEARHGLWKLLEERGLADLVKPYNFDAYNEYSTVHENLLFGRPASERFNEVNFMSQPEVISLFKQHSLYDPFLNIGLRSAEILVDMFKGIDPGHAFFEQFSFVDEDTLPILKDIVNQAMDGEVSSLNKEHKDILLTIPLRLVPQRHRLGLIDNRIRAKLINLRKDLFEKHKDLFATEIQAFDPERYNENLSIQDNILFGSVAFGRADATTKIESILKELTHDLGLFEHIVRASFAFQVGQNGSRLSMSQRQKIAFVRNLLKHPKALVVNDGLNALDSKSLESICSRLDQISGGITTIWISANEPQALKYRDHFEIRNGRFLAANSSHVGEEADEQANTNMGAEAMVLKNLPMFSELDNSQLKLLAFTAERKHYKPGEKLFSQGDDGDTAYVILNGEADVVLEDEDGSESILFSIGKNKLVGELALLSDTQRTATIRAKKDLTALQLNADVFAELARQDANFSYQLSRDLSQRLVDTTAELNAR